jgi:hypothetical protein
MRGKNQGQQAIFTLVTPAQVVPADHPIRKIKELADRELENLSPVALSWAGGGLILSGLRQALGAGSSRAE